MDKATGGDMTGEVTKHRREIGRWRLFTFILLILCVVLLAAVIALAVTRHNDSPEIIPLELCPDKSDQINLQEPDNPSVFHDLTKRETVGLMKFLYTDSSLNLEEPSMARMNSSYFFLAEIYLPPKTAVLSHLDNGGQQPPREARVTIFRGDKPTPVVDEYIVGPLPNPTYKKPVPEIRKNIPFNFRPFNNPEVGPLIEYITQEVHENLQQLLEESFGGKLLDCDSRCLRLFFPVPMSNAVTGEEKRKTWFLLQQFVDTFVLHPMDFAVLVETKLDGFVIESVWYNGQLFASLQDLANKYKLNRINKIVVPFLDDNDELFSKLTARGDPFQKDFKRVPIQIEPDGKRYSINHRHVQYMGWDFDFRMSSVSGPQVYDIRFKNERIAYEISLQEIAVLYSGHKPTQMFPDYFDSCTLIGPQDKGLVPGVDCPEGSTFIDALHVLESSKEPVVFKNAFCVFELNTGYPLRRHHSYPRGYKSYFEGMPNAVLILRSVFTVVNYDYIFDFVFYQNGVIEVRATSTGYVLATYYTSDEDSYGTRIHDDISANMHLHLFHFKVDMDIKGTSNRYETLDIVPATVPNPFSTEANAMYHMTKYQRNLKRKELEAAYKFDFDAPKYLVFYNEQEKNKYGYPKAYRLQMNGMAKQMFAEGKGNEPSASWARYQMAVTKANETERRSSSMYTYLDSSDPVVNFQSFLNDDDNIVDEDLVTWVTMGVHHIPHTEDLPITPSTGMGLSFFLLPYNYFPEDQAIASRSSVRIEFENPNEPKDGVKITRYGPPDPKQCIPNKNKYWEAVQENPGLLLEIDDSEGTVY